MYVKKGKFGWYETCKGKDLNGDKLSYFMPISFVKGCEPKQGDFLEIIPTKWFHSCFRKQSVETFPKMVIQEYQVVQVGEQIKPQETKAYQQPLDTTKNSEFIVGTDELPFY